MTKVTTRQTILGYLKRNHKVTARELARALIMTPANARHHLKILSADGRIEVIQHRNGKRGRPEKMYRLSGSLVRDNLALLADTLLNFAETGKDINMDILGRHLAGEGHLRKQPLIHRLKSIVDRLNEMNYQAHWEAGAVGPRIILRQCPYLVILEKHPNLCQMDTALLRTLSNEDMLQAQKQSQGSGSCVFVMGK